MAVTLNANTSTGFIATSDTSGVLQLQTGGTTAVTVDASQNVSAVGSLGTTISSKTAEFNAAGGSIYSSYNDGTKTWRTGVGIFAAGQFSIRNATDSLQAIDITSAGNVGIGKSSPAQKLDIGGNALVPLTNSYHCYTTDYGMGTPDSNGFQIFWGSGDFARFGNRASGTFTERVRIDSSGNLLVGTASSLFTTTKLQATSSTTQTAGIQQTGGAANACVTSWNTAASGTIYHISFADSAGGLVRGNITTNGSGTTYGTNSDYRLKENIAPMTGALAKVAQLNPVTYNWKSDGSDGQGFIAHELQAVVPDAVTGDKDGTRIEQYEISPAVPATYDEEGNELTPAVEAVMGEREVPVYQGIDTSFLVATLTAAIQEQQAIIQTLTDRITALEGTTP